jgi:hypothetical protein
MFSVIIGKLIFMTCMSSVIIDMVASEVHPLVYLLLAAGALALAAMLMARQQMNRAPTAAELDAQMSPISDDDEEEEEEEEIVLIAEEIVLIAEERAG